MPGGQPQNTTDLVDTIDNIVARIEALETQSRNTSSTIAAESETSRQHREAFKTVVDDLPLYKSYVESKFNDMGTTLEAKFNSIMDSFKLVEEKIKLMDSAYDSLLRNVYGPDRQNHDRQHGQENRPQQFDIASTAPAAQDVAATRDGRGEDPLQANDAWAQFDRTLPPPLAPSGPPGIPPRPVTFQSPFDDGADTPPTRTMNVSTPLDGRPAVQPIDLQNPFYRPPQVHQQAPVRPPVGPSPYPPSHGGSGSPNYDISYKPNEALRKFDGDSTKYRMWSDRMLDHLCRSTPKWRFIVKSLQVAEFPITRAWLSRQHIDHMNAWDLSEKLETFLCTWVSDGIYNRRAQLAGGEHERGNGFEMWRQLFLEHHGGANAIRLGGMRRLQEWPRCTSLTTLSAHLDAWVECLEEHNSELLAAPLVLRSMVLGIIPTEFEDEILCRPEVVTYQDIINFCKVRTTYKRQKALSELARKPAGGRIMALMDEEQMAASLAELRAEVAASKAALAANPPAPPSEEAPPTWAQTLINAITGNSIPDVNALGAATRGRQATRETRGAATRTPSGRRAFNMKFRFNGCWHCGDTNHSRKANPAKGIKGCPKFEKLKAENGGKPPEGYKGVYEKARDAAWEKAQKKKGIVAALTDGNMTENEDSDSDSELLKTGIFALHKDPPSFSHANPFQAIADDDDETEDELTDDLVSHFSNWAKTQTAKPKKKKTNTSGPIRISSLSDLDKLPAAKVNTKKIARALKGKLVDQIALEDDEVLCLVDTGSSVHAADAETHFADYLPFVRETSASRKGDGATTACGAHLPNKGKFVVDAIADNEEVSIPFTNMKVKLPILSARRMMTKGSKMELEDDTGKIFNAETNQTIRFLVHEDLWFMKIKVKKPQQLDLANPEPLSVPPPPQPLTGANAQRRKPGFGRPGP